MQINHIIGNIFTTELMDDNFGGDLRALNDKIISTINASKWNDVVLNTTENAFWIAWEAFITWLKQQLKLRLVDMDDDTLRLHTGDWFSAVFGDHHIALQPTYNYIIDKRNAQKEEENTMKSINTIIDVNTISEDITCSHCGCIVATSEEGEIEAFEVIDGKVYCESCIDDLFVTCEECGERILLEDAMAIIRIV